MGKKKMSKAGTKKTTKAKASRKASAVKRGTKEKATAKKTKKSKSTTVASRGKKKTAPKLSGSARKSAAKKTTRTVTTKAPDNTRSTEKAAAPVRKRRIASRELSKIRTLLSTKKQSISNHLQSELAELEKPEKRHRADLEEIASDTHDTDSLCQIMDIETTQMDQIDMALAKIENGTYGICEDCSEEIPMARLSALPFATQCIECKRKAEIAGQISAMGT